MAVQTKKGYSTATADLVEVLPGLLMVKFLRSSGSEAAFQELFKDIFEDSERSRLLVKADTAAIQPDESR